MSTTATQHPKGKKTTLTFRLEPLCCKIGVEEDVERLYLVFFYVERLYLVFFYVENLYLVFFYVERYFSFSFCL